MKNKFLPYSRQLITDNDIEEVKKVLKSDFITQGPFIENFEKELAKIVNSKYGVAMNSATSALHIACMALNLRKGDYLWTSPITFVASANCARYCGANVDFVDIDKNTGLMSIEQLKIKLKEAEKLGKLPKVIVPVHLTGCSCEMREIHDLSKKYGFYIIEDASHAIGGKYNNEAVGNCKYSDITVFSFHPVKIITSGEGGIATTNNYSLSIKMRELRSHGITKDKTKFKKLSGESWVYEQQSLGFNYRMNDICAALGLSQLRRLEKIVLERNKQHNYYVKILKDLPINLLKIPDNVYSSFHLQVIQFDKKNIQNYNKIFDELRTSGIGVQLHYIPVHFQPYYQDLGFKKGDFPSAEDYSSKSISIPIFPGLNKEDQDYVKKSLERILY